MRSIILVFILIFSWSAVTANEDILLYKIENKENTVSAETIAAGLAKQGYTIAKDQDMNGPYKKQFQQTSFKSYDLMSVYYPEIAQSLVMKYAESGIFAPFSLAVYQREGEDYLYIALLTALAQAKILDVQDPLFQKLEVLNRKAIQTILPSAEEMTLEYAPVKTDERLYTKYSFEIDDEDALEAREEMIMLMTEGMKPSGFVVANYLDLNAELQENGKDDYLFYDAYSLCKLKVIYELSKTKPEAGAFAPCTMVIYHKKGSNTTEIASLNIYNLTSTLAIKDDALLQVLEKAQTDMAAVIEEATE